MKHLIVLLLGLLAVNSYASEPTNKERCEEWAVMDGIASEDMSIYLQECLYSLELPDEDLSTEEDSSTEDEIITAELSDTDIDQ